MYRKVNYEKTCIDLNNTYEGETIETKVEKMMSNKEPINEATPIIHTERKDGVLPAYNVKTDRFDLAIEALDRTTGSSRAKREAKMEVIKKEGNPEDSAKGDGKPESSQGGTSTT